MFVSRGVDPVVRSEQPLAEGTAASLFVCQMARVAL